MFKIDIFFTSFFLKILQGKRFLSLRGINDYEIINVYDFFIIDVIQILFCLSLNNFSPILFWLILLGL